MNRKGPLDGAVAPVTGASSGIGTATPRRVAINEILARPTEQQE